VSQVGGVVLEQLPLKTSKPSVVSTQA
jgi:hypothetical protein